MKSKTNYIFGKRTLNAEDINFYMHTDVGGGSERLVKLCMVTNFDVGAVFGPHAKTLDNDKTLSVYAYFDCRTGQICPNLKVVLWTDNGRSEEYKYALNNEEKKIIFSKMMEYCTREKVTFKTATLTPVSDERDKVCECLFDIALNAGYLIHEGKIEADDSRNLFDFCLNLAMRFDNKHHGIGDGYLETIDKVAAQELIKEYGVEPEERALAKNDKERELEYLLEFAGEKTLDPEIYSACVKALWTAYCIHHDLDTDTNAYSLDASKLWTALSEKETKHWKDFESFKKYVGKDLGKVSLWGEDTEETLDRAEEFEYLLNFANGVSFESEVCCEQFRALWTAYCFHHNFDVDTAQYDADILKLWERVTETEEDTAFWHNLDSFGNYMCASLV